MMGSVYHTNIALILAIKKRTLSTLHDSPENFRIYTTYAYEHGQS